jgi:hypothetical protein
MADPIWLPEVIRAAGVTVDVLDGAFNRGHGDMWDLEGTMEHHTGASGDSSAWGIANHPTLGLCSQLFLPRRGKKVVVCGVGIAWHGGSGGGYPWIKDVNKQLTGMEMDNNGTEGWSSDQYWTGVSVTAAVLNKIGKPSSRNIGHKEWAGAAQGKWDPGGMNMDKRRADIDNRIKELRGDVPTVIENQINRVAHFSPWLGTRLFADERPALDGGKYVDFENGSVYWHPRVGAIAVPKLVYETWKLTDWERGPLGYPRAFHAVIEGVGDVQTFEHGQVYRKYGQEGITTFGKIGSRYYDEGGIKGHLGWPTSNVYSSSGLQVQDFEHGQLLWDPNDPEGTVKVERGDTIYVPPGR